MPTYIYGLAADAKKSGCDVCRGTFEIQQSITEPALKTCPDCGETIERKPCSPNIVRAKPSDASMSSAGFTQYKRKGKGYYEKSFGPGPKTIRRDEKK
jgi:predicted nucleic acid-binding Zn ribbon protein